MYNQQPQPIHQQREATKALIALRVKQQQAVDVIPPPEGCNAVRRVATLYVMPTNQSSLICENSEQAGA
jgi:hypothetical protein